MSCKILRGETAADAVPVAWQPVSMPRKSNVVESPAGGPDTANLQEIAKLRSLLEQTQKACEGQVKEARESGYRDGERATLERASQQIRVADERAAQTVSDLAGMKARLRRQAEADLLKLSIAIARRVLRRELSVDEAALAGIIKVALDRIDAMERCNVRVHPQQADQVRAILQRNGRTAEVAADATLALGGVVFESATGKLDVSVETQLQEIERGLAERLGR